MFDPKHDPACAARRRDARRAQVRAEIRRALLLDRKVRGRAAGERAAQLRADLAAARAEALGTRGARRFAAALRDGA